MRQPQRHSKKRFAKAKTSPPISAREIKKEITAYTNRRGMVQSPVLDTIIESTTRASAQVYKRLDARGFPPRHPQPSRHD